MALDKIKALSAPPGHSFTSEPGKWAWEQPTRFSDPNDAIDFVVDKLSTGESQNDMLKLMAAGITVEELVAQVSFKGFMQGAFNPDVAELIKPAIAMHLMKLGTDNGFSPTMFIPRESEEGGVDDRKFFTILKERNPEIFNDMNERLNRAARLQEELALDENVQDIEQISNEGEGTFINEEPVIEEEMASMEQPVEDEMVNMEQPIEEQMVDMEQPQQEEIV
tara:strand:- start:544 stop:1209 length:666 start_codon:yes stop_codon:yes gene_type:complete